MGHRNSRRMRSDACASACRPSSSAGLHWPGSSRCPGLRSTISRPGETGGISVALRDYLFHEEPGITLYCGDCREVLPLLDPVDAVITGPPYGLGVNYGVRTNDRNPEYLDWLASVLAQCAEVSHDPVVFFPGVVNSFEVPGVLDKAGLRGI